MPPPETCYTAGSLFLVSLYLHPGMPILLSGTQLNYHLLWFSWSELLYPLNIHSRLLGLVWHTFSIAFALFFGLKTLVCLALLLNSELMIRGDHVCASLCPSWPSPVWAHTGCPFTVWVPYSVLHQMKINWTEDPQKQRREQSEEDMSGPSRKGAILRLSEETASNKWDASRRERGVLSIFKIYMLCFLIQVSSPQYEKRKSREGKKKFPLWSYPQITTYYQC